LYKFIDRGLRRYFVHHRHFDECWKSTENKILGLEKRHIERFGKLEKRVVIIEALAGNFDRDMDKYHDWIDKDNADFKKEYNKVIDKHKQALGSAFKRIAKLEDLDVRTFESPYAERIATIERRQKEYDTSLFTQATMIGDLQKAEAENKDRFKKVMDLKNVRVKV